MCSRPTRSALRSTLPQPEAHTFVRRHYRRRSHPVSQVARVAQDDVDVVVGMRRAMMEQDNLFRSGLAGDQQRVLDGAVTEMPFDLELLVRVLRIMDDDVDTITELEHVLGDVVVRLVGATTLRVIGDVRHGAAAELDAEPERGIGVTHPAGADL